MDAADEVVKHTHLRAGLDDGRELRFDDARRFGRLMLGPPALLEERRLLPALGVEPLSDDFTPAHLDALMRRTRRTLKAALLDQSVIAGLGNIYVDEACHLAGIRPTRRAHRLTRRERLALHGAIRSRPGEGDRQPGHHRRRLPRPLERARAPTRRSCASTAGEGSRCLGCGTVLRHLVVAGRTTVYCPVCQR